MIDISSEKSKICLDGVDINKYRESLQLIYVYINEQENILAGYVDKLDYKEDKNIIFLIRNIASEIYSTCEIINELFIAIYRNDDRYRGSNLSNGFNSNFKKIYKAHITSNILNGIYSDKLLNYFYFQCSEWYIMLHDIRTQETHYEIGSIKSEEGVFWYNNNNRNGISKDLYTNPKNVIEIKLAGLLDIIDKFLKSIDFIKEILDKQ